MPWNRYAAYFNNSLFERPEASQAYRRLYTFSNPFEIEVVPLPNDTSGVPFSGLFEPLDFAIELEPDSLQIGELGEARILVVSPAPKELLSLPAIGTQRGLRSRFPQFSILGGCCGTNHRHVSHICYACH